MKGGANGRKVNIKKKNKRFPFRQSLFWDADPRTLDPKKHSRYIIERILDFGDDREVKWMDRSYSKQSIKNAVEKSRVLHDKSRSLWSLVYR